MRRVFEFQHNQLINWAVNYLTAKNFVNIKADISGFVQPNKITWTQTGKGHIPDITAQGTMEHVFEAETPESIFDQHTEDQWTLFDAYSRQHGAEFWVIVPTGSESSAQTRLNQLGIKAKVWAM